MMSTNSEGNGVIIAVSLRLQLLQLYKTKNANKTIP